mmetsp:Transcript_124629/g.248723  ORF Transcript_124629/g.248723 Transcript_124629/m.248723 type:complete len:257 (+) Transcript_124629:499-1269(+)
MLTTAGTLIFINAAYCFIYATSKALLNFGAASAPDSLLRVNVPVSQDLILISKDTCSRNQSQASARKFWTDRTVDLMILTTSPQMALTSSPTPVLDIAPQGRLKDLLSMLIMNLIRVMLASFLSKEFFEPLSVRKPKFADCKAPPTESWAFLRRGLIFSIAKSMSDISSTKAAIWNLQISDLNVRPSPGDSVDQQRSIRRLCPTMVPLPQPHNSWALASDQESPDQRGVIPNFTEVSRCIQKSIFEPRFNIKANST